MEAHRSRLRAAPLDRPLLRQLVRAKQTKKELSLEGRRWLAKTASVNGSNGKPDPLVEYAEYDGGLVVRVPHYDWFKEAVGAG